MGCDYRQLSPRTRSPLRPGVAVGVQRDAFDAESLASLFELRGAVARADRLLPCGPAPAVLGWTSLGLDDRTKSVLPGSRGHARISAGQIRLGDLKIQLGLADGFVAH